MLRETLTFSHLLRRVFTGLETAVKLFLSDVDFARLMATTGKSLPG